MQACDDARIPLAAAAEHGETAVAQAEELEQQKRPVQHLIERRIGLAPGERERLFQHREQPHHIQQLLGRTADMATIGKYLRGDLGEQTFEARRSEALVGKAKPSERQGRCTFQARQSVGRVGEASARAQATGRATR